MYTQSHILHSIEQLNTKYMVLIDNPKQSLAKKYSYHDIHYLVGSFILPFLLFAETFVRFNSLIVPNG